MGSDAGGDEEEGHGNADGEGAESAWEQQLHDDRTDWDATWVVRIQYFYPW